MGFLDNAGLQRVKAKIDALLANKLNTSLKGAANGLAELDSSGKVPSSQLPSYVDDVLEYDSKDDFPTTGEKGKIYVSKTGELTYRWSGSAYIEISRSLALGETSSTAYRGDRGKTAYDHAAAKGIAVISGLYKITTNMQGHVTAATAVQKSDITKLGIPDSDTDTYRPIKLNGAQILGSNTRNPLNLTAGSNVSITNSNGTVTIAATNTNTTYTLTQDSSDGHKLTFTGSDGTSKTFTIPDNNTTYTLSSLGIENVKNYDQSKAITSITRSGTTFTYTCLDGTTGTFTQQDNNTWTAMVGATSSANGTAGYVPAPPQDGYNTKYLRADGTWTVPPDTTYSNASGSAAGLMSAADKTKLDGIANGATSNSVYDGLDSTSSTAALSAAQGKVLNDKATREIGQVRDAMAIISSGDGHGQIEAGQYVYVMNHGAANGFSGNAVLIDGLYKAKSAIGTSEALSFGNLSYVSSGGLNSLQSQVTALNSNLESKITFEDVTVLWSDITSWDEKGGLYRANMYTVDYFSKTPNILQVLAWSGNVVAMAQFDGNGQTIQIIAGEAVPNAQSGGIRIRGYFFN